MNRIRQTISAVLAAMLLAGCAGKGADMQTVSYVDLDRFMGDWYVIANIPTFLEKGAHNAVERYDLNPDGTISTTFTFRDGGFDGKQKQYNPKGFVKDNSTNALWGMRFVWPIKADYRIVYLNSDYTMTVVARQKRDFVWIMARTPTISDREYTELIDFVVSLGYERDKIQRVPQRWEQD